MKHFFLAPTLLKLLLLTGIIMSSCVNNKNSSQLQPAKVYVANEEGGSVSVDSIPRLVSSSDMISLDLFLRFMLAPVGTIKAALNLPAFTSAPPEPEIAPLTAVETLLPPTVS